MYGVFVSYSQRRKFDRCKRSHHHLSVFSFSFMSFALWAKHCRNVAARAQKLNETLGKKIFVIILFFFSSFAIV